MKDFTPKQTNPIRGLLIFLLCIFYVVLLAGWLVVQYGRVTAPAPPTSTPTPAVVTATPQLMLTIQAEELEKMKATYDLQQLHLVELSTKQAHTLVEVATLTHRVELVGNDVDNVAGDVSHLRQSLTNVFMGAAGVFGGAGLILLVWLLVAGRPSAAYPPTVVGVPNFPPVRDQNYLVTQENSFRTVPEQFQILEVEPVERLPANRPPTGRERALILEHYHKSKSINQTCIHFYGYKNGRVNAYVTDVINSTHRGQGND